MRLAVFEEKVGKKKKGEARGVSCRSRINLVTPTTTSNDYKNIAGNSRPTHYLG